MKNLLEEIRRCEVCKAHLPLGANPIISASKDSKIILVSQAPGRLAHLHTKAWDDPSGRRLREWLGVNETTFYDPINFAVLPMGFCYPGKSATGDLPPRSECAPLWHAHVLNQLKKPQLFILIGGYAQKAYLKDATTLTDRVKRMNDYLPNYLPLPHPSPVNHFWMRKNLWFETEKLPAIKRIIQDIL
ncbi:uracil-DNA glycosylase family protein [Gangjinia marincola]|uniref:Uracil-DNA glycosylase family protein n=1 Tax=Gangjinia marincola TaxID=578463 RepID=A0ABP3XV01_9FLAO